MVYSDVINNKFHLILKKREKYTKRDVNKIITESLFIKHLNGGSTFTEKEALFIVKCTAIFHNSAFVRSLK